MQDKRFVFKITILTLYFTLNTQTLAQLRENIKAEHKGYEIAARSDRSDRGFIDSKVQLQMILSNASGGKAIRKLRISTFEVQDENLGDKSLIYFSTPSDIKGTVLLSFAKILDADDQWLYLPALKRVKRISSANKSGPFVSSEFAFEDFTGLELNKYDYNWIGEEACGNYTCDMVTRIPLYKHSGYSKQIAWFDQDVFQIRKVEFYDRRGDLLKTLALGDYREYGNSIWRPHLLQMINHQTDNSTDLIYENYSFDNGLNENDFVKGKLPRLR